MMGRVDHFLELMRMFSAYTGDPMYEEYGISHLHSKEVTMLAVLKEYYDDVREEGREEGREDLNFIYAELFRQGRSADVQRAVEDPEYFKKIMTEFGKKDEGEG